MQPIGPAITSGLAGIRAATARLDGAAARIASAGLPTVDTGAGQPPAAVPTPVPAAAADAGGGDLVGDLVQVRLSVIETAANVRSIEAAIETYRSVLTIGRKEA